MQRFSGVIVTLALVACSRSTPASGTSDSTAPFASRAAQSTAGNAKSPCPSTGLWAICSIEKRLKSAGLVAGRDSADTAMRAGFTVRPRAYSIGRDSRLDLFLYADEAALARDFAKMDTVRVAPNGQPGAWKIPPTLIRSVNLAAVLVTKDAREADRVSLAITAGAPQPAR